MLIIVLCEEVQSFICPEFSAHGWPKILELWVPPFLSIKTPPNTLIFPHREGAFWWPSPAHCQVVLLCNTRHFAPTDMFSPANPLDVKQAAKGAASIQTSQQEHGWWEGGHAFSRAILPGASMCKSNCFALKPRAKAQVWLHILLSHFAFGTPSSCLLHWTGPGYFLF